MSKSITVRRGGGWYGRWRALILRVDGDEMGRLRVGQSLALTNIAEDAVLRGAMDWAETAPFSLARVPDGAVVEIRGRFTTDFRANVGATALPFAFEIADRR